MIYLTDIDRRWDGDKVSIRDKAPEKQLTIGEKESATFNNQPSTSSSLSSEYSFRSTQDIMDACEAGKLPDKIMFNFHPQRWTVNLFFLLLK